MRKIFDQIERDKMKNEYNRTENNEQTSAYFNTLQRQTYDIN